MDIFIILGEVLKVLTSEKQCSKAEHPALYSDISEWKFPQSVFESAKLSFNASILLPFLGLNTVQENKLRNQLSRVAHSRGFCGDWQYVEQLVHIEPYTPAKVLEMAVTLKGTNAFFGNNIRSIKRIYRNMKVSNAYATDNRPVKIPQRKRGYNDKGHLPLKHVSPKGKPIKARPEFKEIPIDTAVFYSQTLVGDRSNFAAELLDNQTSRRKRRRKKKKEEFSKSRNSSKRYLSGDKVTKEEWHSILNYKLLEQK